MAGYKVKAGDTGCGIARKYNTSLKALQAANPNRNLNKLAIGQELAIPSSASGAKKPVATTQKKPAAAVQKKPVAQQSKPSTKAPVTKKSANPFAAQSKPVAAQSKPAAVENTNFTKAQIQEKIRAEAKKQGIDENLALAVVEQESNFDPKAKSRTGAAGLFQLTKIAAKQVNGEKTYDVDKNIKYGTEYLKWCINHTKTNEEALVAYNRGLSAMKKAKADNIPIDSITDKKNGKGYATNVLNIFEKNKNV